MVKFVEEGEVGGVGMVIRDNGEGMVGTMRCGWELVGLRGVKGEEMLECVIEEGEGGNVGGCGVDLG
ncbi:hypothetical protein [Paenibacillus xylanexedens]|uniref:hypothetical protein n=1 Tax=Paenibacillus xylanexedens TaxID=528191 RepID=UPI0011A9CCE1|nr:hypothetical protein [Paenibacillus xylanexedens]